MEGQRQRVLRSSARLTPGPTTAWGAPALWLATIIIFERLDSFGGPDGVKLLLVLQHRVRCALPRGFTNLERDHVYHLRCSEAVAGEVVAPDKQPLVSSGASSSCVCSDALRVLSAVAYFDFRALMREFRESRPHVGCLPHHIMGTDKANLHPFV